MRALNANFFTPPLLSIPLTLFKLLPPPSTSFRFCSSTQTLLLDPIFKLGVEDHHHQIITNYINLSQQL